LSSALNFLFRCSKARIFRFHKSNPPPWDGNIDGDAGLALSDEAPQQPAELFDPAYLEVDRILAARPKPGAGKRQRVKSEGSDSDSDDEPEMEYLVKWQNLGYASATWEDASEIRDDAHIQEFLNHNRLPSDLAPRARPAATSFVAMTESPVYKNDNQLRPWQIDGVNQLLYCWYNRRGVILADEMGLGKTVQTVATMVHIRRVYTRGPFLAIVPLSTLNHWKREFETWSELNTVVYQGTKADRDLIQHYEFRFWDENGNEVRGAYKFEVLLCTFESLMADVTELSSIPFKAIIIDEAHRIKNRESKLFKILQMFSTEFRLLLTGTPIQVSLSRVGLYDFQLFSSYHFSDQNNIEELWTLLNFIDAQTFPSPTAFLNEYGTMTDESQVVKLQTLLRPYMLRRVKEDVAKHIPAKEETIIEVELTTVQKQYYRAVLERNTEFLYRGCKGSNTPKLLNVVMQLRKVCNHPFLIKGAQDKILASSNATLPAHYLQRLIESSGKLVLVDKLLPKLQTDGHKVLIFSQMKMVLDLIEEYCRLKQYVYERIDGDVRGNDRQAAIDRFNRPGSDRFVFLLCTRAGGMNYAFCI
jgi:SNF2 family DNA or RNA helicase